MFRHHRSVLRFIALIIAGIQVAVLFPVSALAAPLAPDNLAVTVPVSGNQLILDWQAVSGAVQYKIYRSEAGGGYNYVTAVTAISFTDTGLLPNTQYDYQVTAVDSGGNESDPAAISAITANSDSTAPSTPANFTAAAPGLTSVSFSWDASTDNVAVSGYKIYYKLSGSSGYNLAGMVDSPDITFTHTGLTPGRTYYYYIQAIDTFDNYSAASATITVTTPADTEEPTRPDIISADVVSSTRIDLTWNPAADNVEVNNYKIFRKTGTSSLTLIGTSTATSYSDDDLNPGTNYMYEVSAVDTSGNESDHSLTISRTTVYDTEEPDDPAGLTATVQSPTSIKLQWSSAADDVGVSGYEIWRGTSDGNYPTRVTLTASTSYTDHSLAVNTRYYYKVVTVDTSGNVSSGVFTDALTQADTTKPEPPTMVKADVSASKTRVYLDWSGASDDVGVVSYEVYRSVSAVSSSGSRSGSSTAARIASTASTSYDDTDVSAYNTYSYYIVSIDGAGNRSANSITISVTTNGDNEIPEPPKNLKVSLVSDNEVKLSWTASTDITGVNGYYIYRAEDDDNFSLVATTTGTSYNDKNLHSGDTYRYYIRAFDTSGNISGKSNTESIYTSSAYQTMTGYIEADDESVVELPDGVVSLEMPDGALTQSTLFTMTVKSLGDYEAAGFYKVGRVVEITAENSKGGTGSKGSTSTAFRKDATLTFEYVSDDLLDYSTSKMGIYKWDSSAKTWRRLDTTISSSGHRAEAGINGLGVYGLLIDTDAPRVPEFTGPAADKELTSRIFLLKGKGEPFTQVEVSINWSIKYTFEVDAKGDYAGEVLLANGENRLRVRGTDDAGNTGEWSDEQVCRSSSPVKILDITGHWAELNIYKLAEAGVAAGYSDNSFRPDKNITRAEFIKFVMAVSGSGSTGRTSRSGSSGTAQELDFTDNDQIPAWAKESIAAAVKAGIVSGYTDGSFRPNRLISREEMAVILIRALKLQTDAAKKQDSQLLFDDDYAVSHWARGAVAVAVDKGLVSGYDDNSFKPAKNATRAEAATLIAGLLDQKKGKKN